MASGKISDNVLDEKGNEMTKLLCAQHARAEYGVTDKQLRTLEHKTKYDPYRPRYATPRRLYLRSELIQLAKQVQESKKYNEEHKEEIAAARIEASKAKKQRLSIEAKEAVKGLEAAKAVSFLDSGLSRVFHTCMERIVDHLIEGLKPPPSEIWELQDGRTREVGIHLEGPSVILRWLFSLRATCKEMDVLVLTRCLPLLAARLGPRYWGRLGLPEELVEGKLTTLLQDPKSLKLAALKECAAALGCATSGTKDVVILRLRAAMGIGDWKRNIPARIALAIKWEKTERMNPFQGAMGLLQKETGLLLSGSCFKARLQIVQVLKAHTDQMLVEAIEACRVNARAKERARIESQRQTFLERVAIQKRDPKPTCFCGNPYKKNCTHSICGNCCRELNEPCRAHGVRGLPKG